MKSDKTAQANQPAKSAKQDKQAKRDWQDEAELPLVIELGFTFPVIFLILLDLLVAGISFTSGASWLDIFIRTAVTTASAGVVLWLLSMNWSNGMMEAAVRAATDEDKPAEPEAPAATTKDA